MKTKLQANPLDGPKIVMKKTKNRKTPFIVGELPIQPKFNNEEGELNATAFGQLQPQSGAKGLSQELVENPQTRKTRPFKASALHLSSSFIRN